MPDDQIFRLRADWINSLVLLLVCSFGAASLNAANPGINKLLLDLPASLEEGQEGTGTVTLNPTHSDTVYIKVSSLSTSDLKLTDAQDNEFNSLTFTVGPSVPSVDFTFIAVGDGVLESSPESVSIRAEEVLGSPRVYAPYTAAINITNNQPPTVSLTSLVTTVDENTSTPKDIATIVVTDDGVGVSNLSLDNDSIYDIDETTSKLFIKSGVQLDHETLGSSLDVTVSVDDPNIGQDPDATASHSLNLADIPENPVLGFLPDVTVLEPNQVVATASATDEDDGAVLTFSLSSNPGDLFAIDPTGGQITFENPSNYEPHAGANVFTVGVVVKDETNRSDSQFFDVTLQDVDEPPIVTLLSSNESILETETNPVTIATIQLTGDQLGTDTVTIDNEGSFELISLANRTYRLETESTFHLDFETILTNPNSVTLGVSAQGFGSVFSQQFDALVVDVPPTVSLIGAISSVDEILEENGSIVPTEIPIATIQTGGDSAGALHTQLDPSSSSIFEIVGNILRIRQGAELDFETDPSHAARILVSDSGFPDNDAVAFDHTVTVNDENEAPHIVTTSYNTPEEELGSISLVGDDVDANDTPGSLVFELVSPNDPNDAWDDELFELDVAAKSLSFKSVPNYEANGSAANNNTYKVELIVKDDENLASDPVEVTVNLVNINEKPQIVTTSYNTPEEVVGSIPLIGNDVDAADTPGSLTFEIVSLNDPNDSWDDELFDLDATERFLSFETAPSFEDNGSAAGNNAYKIQLIVTDDESLSSDPVEVTINLQNVNEPPVGSLSFTNPISVPENASLVGGFTANSPDNEALSYSFSGRDGAEFSADSVLKTVSFAPAPDFENPTGGDPPGENTYEANLEITAGGDSITLPFTVHVQPVDEPPTASLNFPISIPENTTTVGTFTFSDPEGDTPTYSFSGTDWPEFFVVEPSQIVAFTSQPDFESPTDGGSPPGQNTYDASLVITAGEDSISLPFTIGVSNVNEAPSLSLSGIILAVDENTATPLDIATVTIVDDALGSNTPILAGPDASQFEWIGNTLRIAPGVALDHETQDELEVWVQVDDTTVGNTPDDSVVVTVAVDDIPELVPPTIAALRDEKFPANEPFYYHDAVVISDPDTPISALTVSGTSSDQTIITDANVQVIGTGAERDLWIQPVENQFGPVMITLTVDDGTTPVPTSFQYTVLPKGIPPAETDGDTLFDYVENKAGNGVKTAPPDLSDWENLDSDGDTLRDDVELANGFDPCLRDTDGDGVDDNIEFGNTPPIAVADYPVVEEGDGDVTLNPLTNDSDTPDGDLPLVIVSVEPLSQIGGSMTIAADGQSVTYTRPGDNILGVETYDYTIRDTRGGDATATITVSLENNNLDPFISPIVDIAMPANVTWSPIEFTVVDPDGPDSGNTMTFETDNATLFPIDSLTFSGTDQQRAFTLTPTPSQHGTATITLIASDGSEKGEITFNVAVGPHGFLPADSDGDTLFDYAENKVGTGDVTIPPDEWDWEKSDTDGDSLPDAIELVIGTDPYQFDTDGDGVSDGIEFGNDAPIAQNDDFTIEAGFTSIILDIFANDSDPNSGDHLSVDSFQLTTSLGGTVIQDSFGNLRYTTPPGFATGMELLDYTVTDEKGGYADATATINVVEHNIAPGFFPISDVEMPANASWMPFEFGVVDPDGDDSAVSVSWVTDNPDLFPETSIVIAGNGSDRTFELMPASGQIGLAHVTFVADDGVENGSTMFQVKVGPNGLAPADTEGDSFFDYLEDINGNGLEEFNVPKETPWLNGIQPRGPRLVTRNEADYRLGTRQLLFHTVPPTAFLRDGNTIGSGSDSYAGGRLVVSFENGSGLPSDELNIVSSDFVSVSPTQPSGGVAFTIVGDELRFDGVTVGSIVSSGAFPQKLEFDFTTGMTRDMVYQLLLSVSFENLSAGAVDHELTVGAVVTDREGRSSNQELTKINASGQNLPPLVFAGPDREVFIEKNNSSYVPFNLTLDDAWARDPDAPLDTITGLPRALSYSWAVLPVPDSNFEFPAPNDSIISPTATISAPGSYTVQLSATDDAQTVVSTRVITVTEVNDSLTNEPPIVSAGADRMVSTVPSQTSQTVFIEGSVHDPNIESGDSVTIDWTPVAWPGSTDTPQVPWSSVISFGGSDVNRARIQPEVEFLDLNNLFSSSTQLLRYEFEVVAMDSKGETDTDRVTLRLCSADRTPKDIVIVLEYEKLTPLFSRDRTFGLEVVNELVGKLDLETDRVAVVAAAGSQRVYLQHVLSSDRESLSRITPWLDASADAVEPFGITDFASAFRLSRLELSGPRSRDGAEPWIIVIGSGGQANRGNWGSAADFTKREPVLVEARKARAEGVRVISFGLFDHTSPSGNVSEIEEPFLRAMASWPPNVNFHSADLEFDGNNVGLVTAGILEGIDQLVDATCDASPLSIETTEKTVSVDVDGDAEFQIGTSADVSVDGSGSYNYAWEWVDELNIPNSGTLDIPTNPNPSSFAQTVNLTGAKGGQTYFARLVATDTANTAVKVSGLLRINVLEPGVDSNGNAIQVPGVEDLFMVTEGSRGAILDVFANDSGDGTGFDIDDMVEVGPDFGRGFAESPNIDGFSMFQAVDFAGASAKAIEYTPRPRFGGALHEFVYASVPDGELDTHVYVLVDSIADAPVAISDGIAEFNDQENTIDIAPEFVVAPNGPTKDLPVLANDYDPDWGEQTCCDSSAPFSFHIVDYSQPRKLLEDGSLGNAFGSIAAVVDPHNNLVYSLAYTAESSTDEGTAVFDYTIVDTHGFTSRAQSRVVVTSDVNLLGFETVDDVNFVSSTDSIPFFIDVLANDVGKPDQIHSITQIPSSVGSVQIGTGPQGQIGVHITVVNQQQRTSFDYLIVDPGDQNFDAERHTGTVYIGFAPATDNPSTALLTALNERNGSEVIAPLINDENGVLTPIDATVNRRVVDVYGIIDDPDADQQLSYLVIVKDGDDREVMRATGFRTPNAVEAKLAELDLSGIRSGTYLLGLYVFDDHKGDLNSLSEKTCEANGELCAVDWRNLVLGSDLDVGRLQFTVEDLDIPVEGLPLQVLRTYDSWDDSQGDFGFGWRLELATAELIKPENLGANWTPYQANCAESNSGHTITVRLGSETYRFEPALSVCSGFVASLMTFDRIGGGQDSRIVTLETVNDDPGLLTVLVDPRTNGQFMRIENSAEELYDPSEFLLKVADSPGGPTAEYQFKDGQLVRMKDRAGNQVDVVLTGGANDRIKWTGAGGGSREVRIQYENNVIKRVYSPNEDPGTDPPTIVYEYANRSVDGDLVPYLTGVNRLTDKTVSPPVYQLTRYGYIWNDESIPTNDPAVLPYSHYMNRIQNEDHLIARNTFDEEGRLIATTTGRGGTTRYRHHDGFVPETIQETVGSETYTAIAVGMESITDPLDNTTQHKYDDRGNVVETVLLSDADPTFQIRTLRFYEYLGPNSELLTKQTEIDPTGRVSATTTEYYGNETPKEIRVENASGEATTYGFNSLGQINRVTDALNRVTEYQYHTGVGRHIHKIGAVILPDETGDPMDNPRIEYSYAAGDSVEITDLSGHVTRHEYNDLGYVQKTELFEDQNSSTSLQTVEYEYDSNGNLNVEKHARSETGVSTKYHRIDRTYDAAGRLLSSTLADTDANWNSTGPNVSLGVISKFNRLGQRASEIRNTANGQVATDYLYDASANLVGTIYPADHNGIRARETAQFDVLGRLELRTDRSGRTSRMVYDPAGRVTEIYRVPDPSEPSTGNILQSTSEYDAAGRILAATDRRGFRTTYAYDAAGRQYATANSVGEATVMEYDAVGNLNTLRSGLRWVDGNSDSKIQESEIRSTSRTRVTRHVYDLQNRLIRTDHPDDGGSEYFGYDASGRRTTVVNPEGEATHYQYDALGRLQVVKLGYRWSDANTNDRYDPGETVPGSDATFTVYGYDSTGNLTATYDANQWVSEEDVEQWLESGQPSKIGVRFEYDAFGRRTKRTLPGGASEEFSYDEEGLLKLHKQFSGAHIGFKYDALGRLVQKAYGTSAINDPLSDPTTPKMDYVYNLDGRRRQVTYPLGHEWGHESIDFQYDDEGRLARKISPQGTLTYSYDAGGNLNRIESPSTNVSYVWDSANRLNKVLDQTGTGVLETDYELRPDGTLGSVMLPNDVRTSYVDVDSSNRVLRIMSEHVGGSGTAIADLTAWRDRTGRRGSVLEQIGGTNVAEVTYQHDALGRLASEIGTRGSVSVDSVHDAEFGYGDLSGYDRVGNRDGSAVGANDRLDELVYDEGGTGNGNVTSMPDPQSSGSFAFTWDQENRLTGRTIGTETIKIAYDADGNRIRKTVINGTAETTTHYLIDDLNPTGYAQVIEAETTLGVTTYVYGTDLISKRESGGTPEYFGYDALGSVRYRTDSSGALIPGSEVTFDAYGQIEDGVTPTSGDHYLFTGEQFDADLGLYYLRARYYDPSRGIFLSRDPFEGDQWNPQTMHPYAYVHNDPVNSVDPSGNIAISSTLGATAKIAAIGASVGFVGGGVIGGLDAAFDTDPNSSVLDGIEQGATYGLFIGGAFPFAPAIVQVGVIAGGTVLGGAGAVSSFSEGKYLQGTFRAGTSVFGGRGAYKFLQRSYRQELLSLISQRNRARQLSVDAERGGKENNLQGLGLLRLERARGVKVSQGTTDGVDGVAPGLGRVQLKGPFLRRSDLRLLSSSQRQAAIRDITSKINQNVAYDTLVIDTLGLKQSEIVLLKSFLAASGSKKPVVLLTD